MRETESIFGEEGAMMIRTVRCIAIPGRVLIRAFANAVQGFDHGYHLQSIPPPSPLDWSDTLLN